MGKAQWGNCTGDSSRHPLNSADGSAVRNTKRYTLTRRIATATTQITIRGIPRHGKLKISDYGLLVQFGLTPKLKRGLAADVVWVIGGHGDTRRSHTKNFDRLRRLSASLRSEGRPEGSGRSAGPVTAGIWFSAVV